MFSSANKQTQKLTAAVIAVGATFSIVWSIASLAYPQPQTPAGVELVQRSHGQG
jgi:hypothetical protein